MTNISRSASLPAGQRVECGVKVESLEACQPRPLLFAFGCGPESLIVGLGKWISTAGQSSGLLKVVSGLLGSKIEEWHCPEWSWSFDLG